MPASKKWARRKLFMTLYRSDLQAQRDLYKKLQSLIVAPDRASWKEFCEIDPDNLQAGCAKYKQCPKHIKKIDERCWDRAVDQRTSPPFPIAGYSTLKGPKRFLPVIPPTEWRELGHKTWCNHFAPLGADEDKNRPVVAYSYGVICKDCDHKQDGVALAGLYRQCSPPCPFTGCAVPQLTVESEYDSDAAPPLGCPYSPRTSNTGEQRYLPNVFARVQCFISRAEFLRYQTDVLGLHMGFFAFIETDEGQENLYYLARHPYKGLNVTQMVYDTVTGWMPDHYEHQKSYLFLASRELALPTQEADSLLKRLRGPIEESDNEPRNWRGFTKFDRDNQMLYVSDGEMSAFCLRWLLEEARNLWGKDGIKDDPSNRVFLNQLLDRLAALSPRDRPQWYPRNVVVTSEKDEPRGWAVEDLLSDRYLLGRSSNGLTDLKDDIARIRCAESGAPPIVEFMGFDEAVDGISLLEALGIVIRSRAEEEYILATERFWRLIRYLQRYHDPNDPDFAGAITRLVGLASDARVSGRLPKVQITGDDCQALLLWLILAPELESSRAPIGRDGIPGHVMLRRTFKQEEGRQPQVETCARSWIAFPIFAYEPFQKRRRKSAESQQVGFFLGTIDDSDCYQQDGVLDASMLAERLFPLKQFMFLIGSVEAAGTYFEDIVGRSQITEWTQEERRKWKTAIGDSKALRSIFKCVEDKEDARDYVRCIEDLIERRSNSLSLPLELSFLYDKREMIDLTHATHRYNSKNECVEAVKANAKVLAGDLDLVKQVAGGTSAGQKLLDWQVTVQDSSDVKVEMKIVGGTGDQIEEIISIAEAHSEELCGQSAGKWKVQNTAHLRTLAAIRQAFREEVTTGEMTHDCVIPFSRLYEAEVRNLVKRVINKQQQQEPDQFNVTLPELEGDLLGKKLTGHTVRQTAFVIKANNRSSDEDPRVVVGKTLRGHTASEMKASGFTDIVDVFVAVRAGDRTASRALERNWIPPGFQQELQHAVLSDTRASQDGVYWILVLSWIKHEVSSGD